MFKTKKITQTTTSSTILGIVKGAFWGVAFSLVAVLIFAFIIKFTSISENIIQPINQIIKGLSILVGCFVASKKIHSHGWLNGIFVGFLYTVVAFLIFSILDGKFSFGISTFNDIVFGSAMGLISGIICIGFGKNK